jgi:hypothetical protein
MGPPIRPSAPTLQELVLHNPDQMGRFCTTGMTCQNRSTTRAKARLFLFEVFEV